MLPPHFPGHEDYCPWTRAPDDGRWHGPDTARARALVRASGTVGATVDFISPSNDPVAAAAVGPLASALRKIGYSARIIRSDSEFYARISDPHGHWNVSDGDWVADYPSPGQFLDNFLACSNYHPEDPARTPTVAASATRHSTAS